MIDYLDADVAYLLGLIVARGELTESGGVKRIVIEFPFKNLEVEGVEKKLVQKDKILLSLDPVIRRIQELADLNIRKEEAEQSVYLIMETLKETVFLRNIKHLLKGKTTHYEFEIPIEILQCNDENIKKEFVRGYADVAGSARVANRNKWGRHRIYLDVLNRNWRLPVQLCHLLQDHLGVPVDTITYGHPNIRDPELEEYKAGRETAWAREHQVKVFAEEFEKIGFYMEHKREILKELAEYNRSENFARAEFCNPCKRVKAQTQKKKHPGENSKLLPEEIRGKHFDSYRQICIALGCFRYSEFVKAQRKLLNP
jgi:hypothetical protein